MNVVGKAIAAGVVGVTLFAAGALTEHEAKPVQDVEDFIANAPAFSPCPSGWNDESARDEHVVVISCTRGEWRVFLDPDGEFSHGWDGEGDFEFDARRVPNWPAP